MRARLQIKVRRKISYPLLILVFCLLMGALFLKVSNTNNYLFLGQEKEQLQKQLEISKNEMTKQLIRINGLESFTRLEKISKKYNLVYHQKIYPIYPLTHHDQ